MEKKIRWSIYLSNLKDSLFSTLTSLDGVILFSCFFSSSGSKVFHRLVWQFFFVWINNWHLFLSILWIPHIFTHKLSKCQHRQPATTNENNGNAGKNCEQYKDYLQNTVQIGLLLAFNLSYTLFIGEIQLKFVVINFWEHRLLTFIIYGTEWHQFHWTIIHNHNRSTE